MAVASLIRFGADATGPSEASVPLEPLFTPQQVADHLQLDVSTVRRLFADRPGVVAIGRPASRRGQRSYTSIRIGLSVLRDFLAERTQGKSSGGLSRKA